jgi:hypothetical protein
MPTLDDLLNPATDDEEFLFNHPDPYDIAGLGDEEDEEDTASFVHRGASRLDIDKFINLSNKKLQNRYDGKAEEVAAGTGQGSRMVSSGMWVEEEYDAESLAF